MRRDERPYDQSEGESEVEAIAAQWTRKWDTLGGPRADAVWIEERLRHREEFATLSQHLRRLGKGARLLDGGCGMGEWTVYLTRQGYPTVGLDLSEKTIAALKGLFPDVAFEAADIRKTRFPDGTFDLYFSWGTFEHFEEGLGRVIGEAFRVLKPGGLLLASVPFENLRVAWKAIRAPWLTQSPRPATRFYQWRMTRAELSDALGLAGFAVEEIQIIAKRVGLQRALTDSLGFKPNGRIGGRVVSALATLTPGTLIGHMILAVARKPR